MKLLKNKSLKYFLPTITVLLIWEILFLLVNNSYFVPSIEKTLLTLAKTIVGIEFFTVVFTSLLRVLLGLFLGIIFGIVMAALCHYSYVASYLFAPLISIMKATPVACIVVLLWISMTYTQLTVFVVFLMVLPIIWQNVLDGFKSIDQDLLEVTEIFRLTFMQRLRVLIFPTIIKYISPAIITSIGLAWKAGIAAEIMTNSNMGRLIYNYKNVTYDTASIFAWTIIIVSFSLILEKVAKLLLKGVSDDAVNIQSN